MDLIVSICHTYFMLCLKTKKSATILKATLQSYTNPQEAENKDKKVKELDAKK